MFKVGSVSAGGLCTSVYVSLLFDSMSSPKSCIVEAEFRDRQPHWLAANKPHFIGATSIDQVDVARAGA